MSGKNSLNRIGEISAYLHRKNGGQMLEINNEMLRQIQMVQLEMLEEVDRICKKCNIHYNIIAGTL